MHNDLMGCARVCVREVSDARLAFLQKCSPQPQPASLAPEVVPEIVGQLRDASAEPQPKSSQCRLQFDTSFGLGYSSSAACRKFQPRTTDTTTSCQQRRVQRKCLTRKSQNSYGNGGAGKVVERIMTPSVAWSDDVP